jgi:hypothetical protein
MDTSVSELANTSSVSKLPRYMAPTIVKIKKDVTKSPGDIVPLEN